METKTILLKEFEGKRHEINLFEDNTEFEEQEHIYRWTGFPTVIFSGSIEDFLQLPNKEEIAERVVGSFNLKWVKYYYSYNKPRQWLRSPLDSLMSAIGEYKYLIITETEI